MTPPPTVLHWPGGGSWDPSQLSSLVAWYDASDFASLTLSGSSVTQWADKSGAYDLTQRGSLSLPQYSSTGWDGTLPSIDFAGTGTKSLENSTQVTEPSLTIAGVFNANGTANSSRAFGIRHDTTATNSSTFAVSDDNTLRFDGSSRNGSIPAAAGKKIRVASRSTSSVIDHIDGAVNISTSTTQPNIDGHISLGSVVVDPSLYTFNGELAEWLVCDAFISSTDREKIEGYLAHKWGLTANLPSLHPYKSSAP